MSLILSGTDGLSDVDGTAATPAIRGTDTNTGIFFPAADTVAASVGGTEGLRLTSTGLGVGTTSPAVKLDVVGTTTSALRLRSNSAASNGFNIYNDSSTDIAYLNNFYSGAMVFATNNTERMRLDSSGNLGLGVTPSAWKSNFKALMVNTQGAAISGRSDNQSLNLSTNWYEDSGGADRYINNDFASRYLQFAGTHRFFTAPSGTAGNAISFTQAMTLDASGNLGVGSTSPNILSLNRALTLNSTGNQQGIEFAVSGSVKGLIQSNGDTEFIMGSFAAIPLTFRTGNTERARITSGGAVLVGTTSGAYTGAGCVNSQVSTSGDFCFSGVNTNSTNPRGLYLRSTNTTAGDYAIYFEASAATKFYVNGNGVIYSTNTSVQSVSDGRHKENVRDLDKGLAEVLALKPRRFDWKEGKGTGAKDVAGFIAQEVEAVLPELVGEWKESVDAEETFKSIGMANVIPMLVKAIQEQQAIIESLTARITALEAK